MRTTEQEPILTLDQTQELARLLADTDLETGKSIARIGDDVELLVSVRPSEEADGCFHALLSIYQRDVGPVSLAGTAITAEGRRPGELFLRPGRHTRRGAISFPSLPVGVTFRLHVRRDAVAPTGQLYVLAQRPVREPGRLAAAGREGSAPAGPAALLTKAVIYESVCGRLRGTMRRLGPRAVELAVETRDGTLADAEVRLALLETSGRVLLEERKPLQPVPGKSGLWEGHRAVAVNFDAPCEFLFEVWDP